MDEVLAVGDAKFQEKSLGRMGDEAHGGRTVLYVSHNMNTIRTLCNRVIVLDHGRKVFDGDVEQGIGIYNGLKELSSGAVDLESMTREARYLQHRYILKSLKMNNSQIRSGEHLKGNICVHSPDVRDDLGFFWVVRSIGGTPLMRMDTRQRLHLKPGDNLIPFEADVSPLIPGKYNITIALVIRNTWDSAELHDFINDAYCFEVVAGENMAKFSDWDSLWEGYLSGPDIEIL